MALSAAIDFVTAAFGATEAPVFVCSLANPDIELRPQQVCTRDAKELLGFISKWDVPQRACYYCVSTLRPGETTRNKETVSEVWGLHADIDFKDVDLPANKVADEVDRIIAHLRLVPSIVVSSGNGRHCYWRFKEAIVLSLEPAERLVQIERIELALKQLADLIGADMKVTQVAALMRMPGSHNTKFDAFTEVTIEAVSHMLYELDDLEEWLAETSPVILRKNRPAQYQETNPWLEIARLYGFKPPLDVEKRLAGMMYMGGGDAAVHVTQLACSASLLNAGTDIEDVVSMLISATKAAATGYGERWNWNKEERRVRQMCLDWLKKHPISPRQSETSRNRDVSNSDLPKVSKTSKTEQPQIVHLAEHRERDLAQRKKKQNNVPLHIVLGEAMIGAIRARGCDLMFTPKAAWRYADGLWHMELDRAWLDVEIETGAEALELDSLNRLLNETRGWIVRQPSLWRDKVAWDAHKQIPTKSGLVDPRTLQVTPARPEHYCTWRIECEFDSAAACPWWVVMINDFFGDRDPEIRNGLVNVLQEVLGAGLIDEKPRPLSKALILQGGSNAGKSGLLEVFGGLFGEQQISVGLDQLEGAHGLMPFVKRLPWVLHEAFTQGRWQFSTTVKGMITGEPVTINVKNGPMISARIRGPIFWATNHPPQFKEATKAIINRIIVIEGHTEFTEGEPTGVALEALKRGFDKPSAFVLATERSGLLNWAIAGLQRAVARGHIELTDEIRQTAIEIRRDSNLVAGFIEDCVAFDRDRRLAVPDFCAAFAVWYMEHKGEDRRLPSNDSIGKAVMAMGDRRIAADRKELRDKHRRYYCGINLNERGLELWSRAREATTFEGKTASTSSSQGDVNGWIPPTWMAFKNVIAMRDFTLVTLEKSEKTQVSPSVTRASSVTNNVSPETSVTGRSSGEVSSEQVVERDRRPRF